MTGSSWFAAVIKSACGGHTLPPDDAMSTPERRLASIALHLTSSTAENDLVSADAGMNLLLDGKFDRKPNKQAGWRIHDSDQV